MRSMSRGCSGGLAESGQSAFPDLLVAAVAEREQVTILHYDSDYDLIAQITRQPTQWVVPSGTVPGGAARGSRL